MNEDSTAPNADMGALDSKNVQSLLVWGAAAAVVAGALSATGSILEGFRGSAPGLTVSTALMLAAILPQIVALFAFARMTYSIDPNGLRSLRRSGICVFGLGMLLATAAALADYFHNVPDAWTYISLVLLGTGCGALFGYTFGAGRLPILFFAYLIVRYLIGYLLLGKRVSPLDAFAIVSFVLLMGSLFGYPIWFANCLRRAKDTFGSSAVVLAAAMVLSLAATVVFCIWMIAIVASAPDADRLTDDEIEALLAPHVKRFSLISAFLEMLIAGSVASLVFAGRRRLSRI